MQSTMDICNALHSALEARDLDSMLSLYADDAELRVVDSTHPPSRPLELCGKQAISAHFRDIFDREMTHKVIDEVVGSDRLSFSEDCEYPDGTHVYGNATIELRDGKIVREVEVQAWDEIMH
jgi:ketosteroid isomerase-like protein